jgi:predicted enzyme related to lactoylglutathione lyase
MADVNVRGRFLWYDLMTTDPEKAQAFYTKVAGWGTMKWIAAVHDVDRG